jgi:hypothetical protein
MLVISALLHVLPLVILAPREAPDPAKKLHFPLRTLEATILAPTPRPERNTGEPVPISRGHIGEHIVESALDAARDAPVPLKYYAGPELDERPRTIEFTNFDDLVLPPQASGSLIVQFWINEHGAVDMIQIEQSDAPAAIAERLVAERRALRFTAGRKNNLAVRSIVRYEFRLKTEAQSKAKDTRQLSGGTALPEMKQPD